MNKSGIRYPLNIVNAYSVPSTAINIFTGIFWLYNVVSKLRFDVYIQKILAKERFYVLRHFKSNL